MRGTVCPPNTTQDSCLITLLHISTVGEDLKPIILTEIFRDGLEKEHCSWKAASRAEDEGIPTVWAKPMLQHGKC